MTNSGVKSQIKSFINGILGQFSVKLVKSNEDFTVACALNYIRGRGYMPGTIIDVGASNGIWSQIAYAVFPEAHYLLFEPLDENSFAIKKLLEQHRKWNYSNKVAGNKIGSVEFNVQDDINGSSVLFDSQEEKEIRICEMVTLDHEVQRLNLPAPYYVKLDTHGFEIPVLEGMNTIWNKTEFLIIETYNFKLNSDCLRFHEMVSYLEGKGFIPIEIVELRRRPSDKLLWQMDIVFGRKEQKEFKNPSYSAT